MKIVIIGATGFIGRKLFAALHKEEYDITVVSRDAELAREKLGDHAEFCEWDAKSSDDLATILKDAWAVINLAGENLASGRWTKKRKDEILESRTASVTAVVEAINKMEDKPNVLIQASAIGYYGSDYKKAMDENSPPGEGFLAEVTKVWEDATAGLSKEVRLVLLRTGIVLGSDGGALAEMARPFKFGAGGHIGSGKQWLSWIHMDDEIRAIQFFLENKDTQGIYNLTAPGPVTMKVFAKELGRTMHRPSWMHVPAFGIKLLMGQMGEEMLLGSQKVLPKRLEEEGFTFNFQDIRPALTNIFNS
jgi:uncharacterized protein (TIGR01777 family)